MKQVINSIQIFLFTVTVVSVSTCYASETNNKLEKGSSGFEWIMVSNGEGAGNHLVGAQSKSGNWIVPLGDWLIFYWEFQKEGENYGFFEVSREIGNGKWTSSLVSPKGEELISAGRYGTFFWSQNRLVGTGPTNYETINIDLSKLLLNDKQSNGDLNKILIGTWINSGLAECTIQSNYSFVLEMDMLFINMVETGGWSIRGQSIKLLFDEGYSETYEIKVISSDEIELRYLEGANKTFEGKWTKVNK